LYSNCKRKFSNSGWRNF